MREEIKKRAIRRLKILEGQIKGLQRMIGKGEYCINVLQQSSAIKNALSSVEDLILENHLSTHVVEQIKSGNVKKPKEEILKIYKLSKKK